MNPSSVIVFALVAAALSALLFAGLRLAFPGYRLVMEVSLLLGIAGAVTLERHLAGRGWREGLTDGAIAGLAVALLVRLVRLFAG